MNKPTFYEQVGIIIPGSVLVFGLVLFYPDLRILTTKDAFSVGELGLFVLIAYAAGHLVAAIANALESLFWGALGGMPSNWVVRDPPSLLSTEQVENLRGKVGTRLNITIAKMAGFDRKKWWPISRQIYADVGKNGKTERIDTFNGNYGLNRGLASACLVLTVVALAHAYWLIAAGLFLAACIYGYRAYRFGVHYARELYLQFLVL
ncbi:hypothetical protein [Bradyrhizobium sp. CCBAU 45384]|uniref:hypothetical protein n=1 Tax=Bradyrhizobium sp. CCBAU 45384 TaxID=858428 RepID=UPI0023057B9F|nr:hypothetical protein [Bradyrhizobium sp. CCBAU 45384]MDA9411812.1 hypothetical protein [Bradyrhizobium sp. CCBAU 45384]